MDVTTLALSRNYTDDKTQNVEEALINHTDDGEAHGIGDKSTLLTTEKVIVDAINELFIDVGDVKNEVKTAITGKGGTVNQVGPLPSTQELVDGVKSIPTGSGNLSNADRLRLINKVNALIQK